jgi:two-component system sensor histidine kinase BarA
VSKGGIRQKLLMLTLAPALAMLVLLFGYFSYQDIRLLQSAMVERGITVARYLAEAAEFGVATGNLEQLRRMTSSVLEGEVLALRIYDMDERLLLTDGEVADERPQVVGGQAGTTLCAEQEHRLVFCAPINLTPLAVSDFEIARPLAQRRIGRLEVTLSTERLLHKRDGLIARSAGIAALVLLLAVFLTRRIERQITRPLLALSDTVERVKRGELEGRVDEDASGELLRLQQGVNAMIASLAHYRDDMAAQVAEATTRLREALQSLEQKNRDLEVQRQRAESASLAKSQFLATMSHEIRTPLSGMIGMLSLMVGEEEAGQQRDHVQHLLEAASALRLLIDEILDFSRIEAGKLTIQSQPFTPAGILDDVAVMLAPSAHHKELELIVDAETPLPQKVLGDPLRFRQILINLTANAIKFTSEGSVLLRITTESARHDEEAALLFEVFDTGIGIDKAQQQQVFESFTQLESGTTRRYSGSGLGTTISRELVQLMGGEIGVDSEPGKGSRFWFRLSWPVLEAAKAPRQVLAGRRLLLYEPQPQSAAALQRMLHTLAAEVEWVADSAALEQALGRQAYDDIILSENSSAFAQRDLAEWLRQRLQGESHPPRLCHLTFVNGDSTPGLFDAHMSKPLTLSRLLTQLQPIGQGHAAEGAAVGRPLTVLLAEDNAINARVIEHLLKAQAHQVVHVESGRAALSRLRGGGIDAVLMDVRMPEMDGLTATRLWREEEQVQGGHLPIIALTANDSMEDRQACLGAGMDDFLVKPVTAGQLRGMLQRYCCGG